MKYLIILLLLSGCKILTHQPINCHLPLHYPEQYIIDRVPYGLPVEKMYKNKSNYIIPDISFEACLGIRNSLRESGSSF